MEVGDHDVMLELDGPGISPESVDPSSFLRLASAFFRLLEANAGNAERPLSLSGAAIIDKCVALRARTDNAALAQIHAASALRQIGGEEPPHGLLQLTKEARDSVRSLPAGQQAKVIVGPWARPVPKPPALPLPPFDAFISIRATLQRVGGKTPAVRFSSAFEEDFSLQVTPAQACELGAMLYRDVDVEAVVSRDGEGRIEGGELRSYAPVQDEDPRPVWKAWFESVGGAEWDTVEDLNSELKH